MLVIATLASQAEENPPVVEEPGGHVGGSLPKGASLAISPYQKGSHPRRDHLWLWLPGAGGAEAELEAPVANPTTPRWRLDPGPLANEGVWMPKD